MTDRSGRRRAGHPGYVNNQPGFYVVNSTTNIGNERYASRARAEHEIELIRRQYAGELVAPLVVVEIAAVASDENGETP